MTPFVSWMECESESFEKLENFISLVVMVKIWNYFEMLDPIYELMNLRDMVLDLKQFSFILFEIVMHLHTLPVIPGGVPRNTFCYYQCNYHFLVQTLIHL